MEIKSSCERPDRNAELALTLWYRDSTTQDVKSISCVAKSSTTPTSEILEGKKP